MSKKTSKIVEKQVWQALSQVKDPELGLDIVSLGLIYGVKVQPKTTTQRSAVDRIKICSDKKSNEFFVWITMTLTTPGCPLVGVIQDMIKEAVASLPAVGDQDNVSIELVFDPPWVPDMMTPAARAELDVML